MDKETNMSRFSIYFQREFILMESRINSSLTLICINNSNSKNITLVDSLYNLIASTFVLDIASKYVTNQIGIHITLRKYIHLFSHQ